MADTTFTAGTVITSDWLNDVNDFTYGFTQGGYSEGTWTASAHDAISGGNASPTTSTGYYTKIGRLVFISFNLTNIDTTGMTGGNVLYFSLPFTASASFGDVTGTALLDSFTFPSSATQAVLFLGGNTSRLRISGLVSGAVDANFTVASISSGVSDILVTATYRV